MIAGGIISTLTDEAMAHTAQANPNPGGTTATIEMNIRYLKGCALGKLTAVATLINKGRRVITLQADVVDTNNRNVAQAGASFMVLDKKIS